MSVSIDSQALPAEQLGLKTVGQVLAHVSKGRRLVVNLLLDGQTPDLSNLSALRAAPLLGHTLFIETADPMQMARSVLADVDAGLDEADRLSDCVVGLLRENQTARAIEKLSGCFSTWQHAQESIQKVAQLLRIDTEQFSVDGMPYAQTIATFAEQLRQIRTALENRDYVLLTDVLTYELPETRAAWRAAVLAIRQHCA
jgi:hypothetical protein